MAEEEMSFDEFLERHRDLADIAAKSFTRWAAERVEGQRPDRYTVNIISMGRVGIQVAEQLVLRKRDIVADYVKKVNLFHRIVREVSGTEQRLVTDMEPGLETTVIDKTKALAFQLGLTGTNMEVNAAGYEYLDDLADLRFSRPENADPFSDMTVVCARYQFGAPKFKDRPKEAPDIRLETIAKLNGDEANARLLLRANVLSTVPYLKGRDEDAVMAALEKIWEDNKKVYEIVRECSSFGFAPDGSIALLESFGGTQSLISERRISRLVDNFVGIRGLAEFLKDTDNESYEYFEEGESFVQEMLDGMQFQYDGLVIPVVNPAEIAGYAISAFGMLPASRVIPVSTHDQPRIELALKKAIESMKVDGNPRYSVERVHAPTYGTHNEHQTALFAETTVTGKELATGSEFTDMPISELGGFTRSLWEVAHEYAISVYLKESKKLPTGTSVDTASGVLKIIELAIKGEEAKESDAARMPVMEGYKGQLVYLGQPAAFGSIGAKPLSDYRRNSSPGETAIVERSLDSQVWVVRQLHEKLGMPLLRREQQDKLERALAAKCRRELELIAEEAADNGSADASEAAAASGVKADGAPKYSLDPVSPEKAEELYRKSQRFIAEERNIFFVCGVLEEAIKAKSEDKYWELYDGLLNQGDAANAEFRFSFLDEFQRVNPDDWHVYQTRAKILVRFTAGKSRGADDRRKVIEEAKSLYRKALELNPDSVMSVHDLGSCELRLRNYPGAERYYRQGIEMGVVTFWQYQDLANCLIAMKRTSEAMDFYERAVKFHGEKLSTDKGIGEAHKHLAGYYLGQGSKAKFEIHSNLAIRYGAADTAWKERQLRAKHHS